MENYVHDYVVDFLNNYIESEKLANTSEEEFDKIANEIYEKIGNDSDLYNLLIELIEYYYWHYIENDERRFENGN